MSSTSREISHGKLLKWLRRAYKDIWKWKLDCKFRDWNALRLTNKNGGKSK